MRNKKILPDNVVPPRIRLGVYKEALGNIESNTFKYEMESFGLCLLLPCILWDLKSYLKNAPNGEDWTTEGTQILFPELADFLRRKGCFASYTDEERISFLKESIETLSKTI